LGACWVHDLHTDSDLKRAVELELEWTPSVDSTHIGIAVDAGSVTLTGEVDSYPARLSAEAAALRVRGVKAVAEEITVHSPWSKVNDSDIAKEAGEALDRAIDVPSAVNAIVHDHVITLSGTVGWQFEREAAARTVRYLKGVSGVTNHITVTPSVSAAGVNHSITAALVRSAQLEGRAITVTANDGAVTLEGTVRSWAERHQAEATAWAAPGVTTVHNYLHVTP
jgi:osmotically-inducible protein OsmY